MLNDRATTGSTTKNREGYTTGSCATAAAKAALIALLSGQRESHVSINTPIGKVLTIPIAGYEEIDDVVTALVIKDAGDDPDITNGAIIKGSVSWSRRPGLVIEGGKGVGVVTKAGLAIAPGQAAINPGPRKMLTDELTPLIPEEKGIRVLISVPQGEELALKTMNPALGIIGGISILGTTGIVYPMSEEAYKKSLEIQLDITKAQGSKNLVFSPGRMGQLRAVAEGIPEELTLQTSNYIGFMLEEAVKRDVKKILMFGHIGKLIKLAGGIFQTHNRVANSRQEILVAALVELGAPLELCRKILTMPTSEEALQYLVKQDWLKVYFHLAEKAALKAKKYTYDQIEIGVAFTDLEGRVIAWDSNAEELGRELGWKRFML